MPRQLRWDIRPFPPPSLCPPVPLTEVFGGGAVLSVDNDQPWPQDLQGGHVGRQDTKGPRLRGHIHLPDIGAIEENLEKTLKEWVAASQAHAIRDSVSPAVICAAADAWVLGLRAGSPSCHLLKEDETASRAPQAKAARAPRRCCREGHRKGAFLRKAACSEGQCGLDARVPALGVRFQGSGGWGA